MLPTARELWSQTAAAYAEAAPELGIYRLSNLRLAEMLRLDPGLRLLDLACGTGATTRAAFDRQSRLGPGWAVDAIPEMVEIARRSLADLPVSLIESPAEELAQHLEPGVADRVICNGAFFQFDDYGHVLAQIRGILTSSGLLGLTVPGPSNAPAMVEHLKRSGLGRRPPRRRQEVILDRPSGAGGKAPPAVRGKPPRGRRSPCNHLTIHGILRAAGWEVLDSELLTIPLSKEEVVRWMTMPIFRWPEWRGVADEELARRLEEALATLDFQPDTSWQVVVARPRG